jgi:hypothetical protein
VIGSTLNQIKRGGTTGILPTTAQLADAKVVLERIHNTATDPLKKQMSKVAWDEINRRHEGMKIIDDYTGGGRARYQNAGKYREGLIKLQADIEAGKVPDVFSPEQKIQIAKVAEGGALMRGAESASELTPLHGKGLGAAAVISYLASVAGPELKHFVVAGVPTAVAMVAKVAYPHFTKNQINKLVRMVQRGKQVPGAPAAFAPRRLTYPPLQPALAAQRYSNLEGE